MKTTHLLHPRPFGGTHGHLQPLQILPFLLAVLLSPVAAGAQNMQSFRHGFQWYTLSTHELPAGTRTYSVENEEMLSPFGNQLGGTFTDGEYLPSYAKVPSGGDVVIHVRPNEPMRITSENVVQAPRKYVTEEKNGLKKKNGRDSTTQVTHHYTKLFYCPLPLRRYRSKVELVG